MQVQCFDLRPKQLTLGEEQAEQTYLPGAEIADDEVLVFDPTTYMAHSEVYVAALGRLQLTQDSPLVHV